MNIVYLIFFLIIIIRSKECSLDVQVIVPATIIEDKPAAFFCLYNLRGEPLYSVKWYRGSYEFFRYEPKENPKCKFFPLPVSTNNSFQIELDISKSNPHKVAFKRIGPMLSGNFSCEVTTDAPHFSTSVGSAIVKIWSKNEIISKDDKLPNHQEVKTLKENIDQHQFPKYIIETSTNNSIKLSSFFSIIKISFLNLILLNILLV